MKTATALALAALATTALLGGCAVGPDFALPHWDLGKDWKNGDPVAEAAKPLPVVWWGEIGDPVLNALVDKALADGLSVKVAEARLQQARAVNRQALSALTPTVSASGSAQYAQASSNGNARVTDRDTHLFSAGFDASWEIDVFGTARRGYEASLANLRAAREDVADARLSLAADVVSTYMDYRLAEERIRLAEENVAAQERTVQLTEARNRVGDVSGLDVAQARSQMLATRAALPLYRQQMEIARGTLAVLLNEPPTTFVIGDGVPLASTTVPMVPAGLPSTLLARRPDVLAAEQRWRSSTALVGVAEAQRFPQFSLTAALGSQSAQMSNLLANGSGFWSLVPAVALPVFDGGYRRAQVELRKGEESESAAAYRQSVLLALRDVETALTGVQQERVRFNDLTGAATSSERAFRFAQSRYKAGEEGLLSVLQAQGSLTTAQDAQAQSRAQLVKNWVSLVKALGGGYASPTVSVSGTMPVDPGFSTAKH